MQYIYIYIYIYILESCQGGPAYEDFETWDLRPETWDLRPETRDLRPETWDLRPETWDLRPETRDPRPETRDLDPEYEKVGFCRSGDVLPTKMNHFSTTNLILKVPKAPRHQKCIFSQNHMRRITCGRETDHTNWALNARPKAKVNALGPSKKDCGLHVITKPCSVGHPANIPSPNIYIYIYMYIYIDIYTYTHIYIYTHTHTLNCLFM